LFDQGDLRNNSDFVHCHQDSWFLPVVGPMVMNHDCPWRWNGSSVKVKIKNVLIDTSIASCKKQTDPAEWNSFFFKLNFCFFLFNVSSVAL
jgi:hypothetical protein